MQKREADAAYIRHIVEVMKSRYTKDSIILFHVGDNYECFGEDAEIVSQVLGIAPETGMQKENGPDNIYVTRFPSDKLAECHSSLIHEGYSVVTNEMRGEDGKHILKIYEEQGE